MERYVFENRNFKRCFYSWVQGWKFVSSCRMVHWGSCQLTYLIYSIGGLLYEALPDVSQMVTGIPEFKKEHEGTCPRCTKGKSYKGIIPLM